MATGVSEFGDILASDEDDSHVGILHSTAIGDISDSDLLAHDVSIGEDQVCMFYWCNVTIEAVVDCILVSHFY